MKNVLKLLALLVASCKFSEASTAIKTVLSRSLGSVLQLDLMSNGTTKA